MNGYRKLTGPERKQIERTALDHPFFDVPGTVLSRKEAKAIVCAAADRKTGTEIVKEACIKAGVPYPASLDARPRLSETFKELFTVPAIRRIGIAVLALILIVVFFAATPIGRSVAESVIRYIGTVMDGGELIINRSDVDNPSTIVSNDKNEVKDTIWVESEDTAVYLDSFAAFTETTGITPFVLPLPCIELYYNYDEMIDYLALFATYETPSGIVITVQIWGVEDMGFRAETDFTVYDTDNSIYYSIGGASGEIDCVKILEDSVFTLTSRGSYTLDELIGMLTGPDAGTVDATIDDSDDTELYVYVDSFEEFTEATGKTPFVLPLPQKELYYFNVPGEDELTLFARYDVPDGSLVEFQIWNAEDLACFASTDYRAYGTDGSLFIAIEDDGAICCIKLLEDSVLSLTSKTVYTLDELIDMLKDG